MSAYESPVNIQLREAAARRQRLIFAMKSAIDDLERSVVLSRAVGRDSQDAVAFERETLQSAIEVLQRRPNSRKRRSSDETTIALVDALEAQTAA